MDNKDQIPIDNIQNSNDQYKNEGFEESLEAKNEKATDDSPLRVGEEGSSKLKLTN